MDRQRRKQAEFLAHNFCCHSPKPPQSLRVLNFIVIGVSFGLEASGDFRQWIIDSRDHWAPILQAKINGTLDIRTLSQQDQDFLQKYMPVTITWMSGMLEWGNHSPNL